MRNIFRNIILSALAFSFFSCQEELSPETADNNKVSISARISLGLVTRVSDDGASFSDGDAVAVQNLSRSTKNLATYTYSSSSGVWSTADALFWEGSSANDFIAWYPATSAYDSFTVPTDQSEGTDAADWMTAAIQAKRSNGSVALEFSHHLSKITVDITDWGTEFAQNERVLTQAQIMTSSTVLTNDGSSVSGDDQIKSVSGYVDGTSFKVIVAPGTYASGAEIMKLYINGASEPLSVKTSSDITLASGKAYTFKVSVGKDVILLDDSSISVNDWDDEFLDDVVIESGNDVSKYVDLSADGTANCYIVSEAGAYRFTATRGNSSASVGTIASVRVLWESFGTDEAPAVGDLVKNVKCVDGVICFDTPETFKEGNAVIAAKNESGTVLWSWHIWLTDEPQEHVYNANAGTLMDRNLGATSVTPGDIKSYGLLYQWGRKDPFLGSSSLTQSFGYDHASSTATWPTPVLSQSSTGTLDYARNNPMTFIYGESSSYDDWVYSGGYPARWSSEKTEYDPCPAGWRVPDGGSAGKDGFWAVADISSAVFSDVDKGFQIGISSPASTWYPASGLVAGSYNGFFVSGAGMSCYYWSATTSGFDAYMMSGSASSLNLYSEDNKSYGCSVRCFKEGTGGGTSSGSIPDPKEGDYIDENGNHGQGIEIGGTVWAPVNVGAKTQAKYGSYFTWYNAHQACPEGWRMPYESELVSLAANSQAGELDGVKGRWFSASSQNFNSANSVFLPSAGDETGKIGYEYAGYYWSYNAGYIRNQVNVLSFTESAASPSMTLIGASQPLPVRCVRILPSELSASEITIDGLTWKTRNIGAATPSEYGNYYLSSEASFACPDGWRRPEMEEMIALSQNYSENVTVDGVRGRWFSGSNTTSNSSTGIFLPMAGYQDLDRDGGTRYSYSSGYYIVNSSTTGFAFAFTESGIRNAFLNSDSATPLRCVKGTYNGPAIEPLPGTNSTEVNLNGLIWASKNVGAETIEDYGDIFTYDEAMTACPDGWRLPSQDEMNILIDNRAWMAYNGVFGLLCAGDNGAVFKDPAVFLPASSQGSQSGYYWTSSSRALSLSNENLGGYSVSNQFAVRCVKGEYIYNGEKTEGASYTLDLAPSQYGWQLNADINPNSMIYDGVYQSTNYHIDSSQAMMYIDINGYEEFTIYIRSNSEKGYDYMMVSQLDKTITGSTSYSDETLVKAHTATSVSSTTDIGSYTEVTYTGIGKGSHRITIVYKKDGSDDKGTDRAYVLIPKYQ